MKHAEFCVRSLDGAHKDLNIQTLEVCVQNPTTNLTEKEFPAPFWYEYQKEGCPLSGTLEDLMRGALGQGVASNWSRIARNIQQQPSYQYNCTL